MIPRSYVSFRPASKLQGQPVLDIPGFAHSSTYQYFNTIEHSDDTKYAGINPKFFSDIFCKAFVFGLPYFSVYNAHFFLIFLALSLGCALYMVTREIIFF